MFRMTRIVRNQQSTRQPLTVRLSPRGKILALAAVLCLTILTIYSAASLSRTLAKTTTRIDSTVIRVHVDGQGKRLLNLQEESQPRVEYEGTGTATEALR